MGPRSYSDEDLLLGVAARMALPRFLRQVSEWYSARHSRLVHTLRPPVFEDPPPTLPSPGVGARERDPRQLGRVEGSE